MLTYRIIRTVLCLSCPIMAAQLSTYDRKSSIFGKGVASFKTLSRLSGVKVQRCRRECYNRVTCQGALYSRTRGHLCTLIASDGQSDDTVTETGQSGDTVSETAHNDKAVIVAPGMLLLVGRFSEIGEFKCGDTFCKPGETCRRSRGECKISECGEPAGFYGLAGNMYGVGRVQRAIGVPESMTITCDEDSGLWTPNKEHESRDCTDLFGVSGQHTLSAHNVDVYCDMDTDEGHWLVFQRRQDGSENFERGWNDYVEGFGDLAGEFWFGLEKLHQILSVGEFELRIDLEAFDGERRYAKYGHFTVAGSRDKYRLTVSGYSGNAGDNLAYHNGSMFSTFDEDNDNKPDGNCADYYQGGWWFIWCHRASLNSRYIAENPTSVANAMHIHWLDWRGYTESLKATEMKLRRKWVAQ